ncbi:mitochondrial inner membrane protein-domain-containing protein [Aspergillus avenaceus]|uniref:MICOS complex subunit MIC60 n=1 Tax=Aspergillus avenaceus TaxID=36643 RepID=A0A5N6U2N4_ASPAV|nr:mitochondrial inner membrane protein-domain-containing protein [Aspergillus avenaceus]
MLRSSVAPGRQLLLSSTRQRTASLWLSRAGASSRLSGQRFFADAKPPTGAPTPASPSSETPVPPETIPKPSPSEQDAQTPPPPPPARKTGRFRRFLIYLILTSGLAYGGGIFLALKSDNFHDFFTEYIPYGEESVLYFEERDFYRRFPNTLKGQARISSQRDEAKKITIPRESGLTSKAADEQPSGSDVSQKGPHMNAVKGEEAQVKTETAKPEHKTAAVEKAKSDKATKEQPKGSEKKSEEPRQPALSSVTPLEFAQVNEGDEAIVQELVKTFNDLITVISADEKANQYSNPVAKAKQELQEIGDKIIAVREEARRAAQDEINKAHATFDESARELIRRFEESRAADAAQYREEFESEREKLAYAYQQKIQTELLRAQEIAEQRLKNELVEQAIELNRKYLHEVKDLVEREREGRLSKLGELTANVSELEKLTTSWKDVIDTNLKTQQLQVAVDAVRSVLERSSGSRPFVRELVAVKELAGEDPVVEAAIASINPTAYQRGIPSKPQIIERFRRVADEVRKASLLPEDAGIASHAASLVLSKVMFKKDPVANSDDVESVLIRTESLLEEGDLDAAAREMNGLKGWAKILSKDWLGDVRRVLEVRQALEGTDASSTPANPLPEAEKSPRRFNSLRFPDRHDSNRKINRHRSLQMTEGRESGELEGSTLGSSSRDGEKGARPSRRTHGSGGFLLDTAFLPRSSSLKHTYHRARQSEPEQKEKRGIPPDAEIVMPKKRSRFPWSRHKETSKPSTTAYPDNEAAQPPSGPSHVPQDAASHAPPIAEAESGAAAGLDKESLQIVNLALNLSESRRISAHGRLPSNRLSGGGWSASAGHSAVPQPEGHTSVAIGGTNDGSHPRRSFTTKSRDERVKTNDSSRMGSAVHAPSTVLSLLPDSVKSNALPQGFSDGTLARAEKARRHFELFSEYLRLLPSLPPLKPSDAHSQPSSTVTEENDVSPGRSYNPLQSIRNRKIRFRERCPIDTETEGWGNIDKVREWVNSIEVQYSHQGHSSLEFLKLPHFQRDPKGASHKEPDNEELLAASPTSSPRRASRTSSIKARRPKSDWTISPPELLADVAWVEDVHNKSKLIDRDGNSVFPDPTVLVSSDALKTPHPPEQLPSRRESVDTDQPTSRTSLSDAHPGLTTEFKRIGRGRRRHRFQGPSHIVRSSTGKRGLRSRSSSSSSASSRDEIHYKGFRGSVPRDRSASPRSKRVTAPSDEDGPLDVNLRPKQSLGLHQSWKTSNWVKPEDKRESMSSAPSIDDRYDRLTSTATADSRLPYTPVQTSFFPSIASNFSTPSSRSPSPSKGRLSRVINARRDRSKSNTRHKDAADNSSLESEALRNNSLSGYSETTSRTGKLEPNSLPDHVSYTHQDDRMKAGQHGRKGHSQHKLRGILKGPGKIAEKVGNEVSKMGGLILKKDSLAHSRKSSFESTSSSGDDVAYTDADEPRSERHADPKSLLRRFPAHSDDPSLESRREAERTAREANISSFTSPSPLVDREGGHRTFGLGSPQRHSAETQDKVEGAPISQQKKLEIRVPTRNPGKAATFGPELHTIQEQIKKGRIKDPSIPYSLTRPPITGLAQAKATLDPSTQGRHRASTSQSRSWSISDRSVPSSIESGVPGKREVERTRALLLSSGIKAREITRRSQTVRCPPPEFLQRAFGSDAAVPQVPRSCEFDLAAQTLAKKFEHSQDLFWQSLDMYPSGNSLALRSRLNALEDLFNNSLNPRVQAATQDAEDLSIQLNTTCTLAVKQLSDTLDKGIRRRHRRLRWIRRTGFVMLEWALVGALWWVWLIVMVFKVFRGVFRGMVSGVRWVLWL